MNRAAWIMILMFFASSWLTVVRAADDPKQIVAEAQKRTDAKSQRYTYVWKTLKTFNTCRQFRMTLIDGTTHIADFKFTK